MYINAYIMSSCQQISTTTVCFRSKYCDMFFPSQAMALKAYPPVAPTALENLSLMVDDIWYMAGDKSTDINWYTKRGVLAAIYTSTGE